MKHRYSAVLILAAAPVLAQQTGVAHPPEIVEDVPAVESTAAVPQPAKKPSPAIPGDTVRPAYTDASPAVTLKRHDLEKFNPDANIVTDVPEKANELPAGTLFKFRLKSTIETASTQKDSLFRGELTEPIQHMGRILIPAGSILEGHVTQIRGGRRFRGAAMIHLQAQRIVLPDGTRVPLNASVVDTDQYASTRIDSEGNIIRKDQAGKTLASMSLATGGAAAAGGVIGGIPGALIGAGIGAGISTVWWLKQDRQTQLPADSLVVMALSTPLPLDSMMRDPQFSASPSPLPASSGTSVASAPAQSYVPEKSFVPMQ